MTDEQINKKYCLRAMGILFCLKEEGNLTTATTWIKLEHNMLRELSQSQKKYCIIPLYEVSRVGKFIETESRMVLARGWGQEE